jgi:hypothetical protein
MYALVLWTALAQPGREPAAAGGLPPAQMLARMDKGTLAITQVSFSVPGSCYGSYGSYYSSGYGSGAPAAPPGKAAVKVKVTSVLVTTVELPAKNVEAHTTDGRAISATELAKLLTKDRTVLVALDGKKVDPFFLQLYKEGTIVLVPPANTLNMGYGAPVRVPPLPEKGKEPNGKKDRT